MGDRNNLNYLQRKQIDAYLETVVKKGEDGFCDYTNGESDLSVAKRFNCTVHNVENLREMVYGKLRPATPKFVAEEAFRKLEERVKALEATVERLASRPAPIDTLLVGAQQQSLPLKAAE